MKRSVFLATALLAAGSASANDSVAEIGAGGIVLGSTDAVLLEKEVLFISPSLVTVDYVFRNQSDKDVDTIVAFPMPVIEPSFDSDISIPEQESDNFLGFSVTHDGQPVTPSLDQRAFAAGVDVTEDLKARAIPLMPTADVVTKALAGLPDDVKGDWIARGLIREDEFDAGQGLQKEVSARWGLRSAYWWKAQFPAGKALAVSHRYKPAVGASAGLSFFFDGKRGDLWDEYAGKYCIDDGFEKALKKKTDAGVTMVEKRIDYILTSGGNWATGTIGSFTLAIDKGSPDALVSFCGEGVKKTGPTRFELTATDFYPERDIHILVAEPISD